MKRTVILFLISLTITLLIAGCTNRSAKPDLPEEPYRVLFIGDSTTSRHDIPGKFEKLAELGGHEVVVTSSTRDSTSLAAHTRLPKSIDKLENEEWDIVVLQETETILLDPESRQNYTIPMIEKFIDIVNGMDGAILLYSSIGFRDGLANHAEFAHLADYFSTQDAVDKAYLEIGNQFELPIAPVGEVWREVYDAEPAFDLWQDDGYHVSPEGAYLAACVFYTAIYNQSPLDLPSSDEFGLDQATIKLIHQFVADVVSENQDMYRLPIFRP
jgi:hypothetical protein